MAGKRRKQSGRYRGEGLCAGSVLTALCLVIFLFTLAVVLVLQFRWLYYTDITLLSLESASGMSAADIRANYDALIDYNLLWHRGSLVFPTLPMSAGGAIHFQEVKRIFDGIWIACIVSGILSLFLLIRQHRLGRRKHFTIAGILAIVIPAILGILVAIDWERFFVTFHKLAFRNDFWLFDPATDPVILILPDTYFLQCAVGILAIILIGAVVFLLLGRRRK